MLIMRVLAAVAVTGCAAIALAPHSDADPARVNFQISFRYDADKSALDNYLAFTSQAKRACRIPNGHGVDMGRVDQACAEDLLQQLVARMERPQLASIHATRTGVRADSSRTLAAR